MDCFDTILALTNMQTKFYKTSNSKFSKNYQWNSQDRQIASIISICSCTCQPMILPIKLVTSVLCILAKFRNFLKPVTVL